MTTMLRAPLAAFVLAGAALGLSVACSGETLPFNGALMLSIQTDLSAPKDVSSVGLYITSDGKPIFSDTRAVAPNGEVKFPATIAILADPDRPRAVVKIRAIAFKQSGDVRVLRDIITTVPKGRTALLRAPLLWINEGSGTGKLSDLAGLLAPRDTMPDGFTRVTSACPDGQTFLEGECGDANVDSATLPDYQEKDVFGGGDATGNGGRCFDVLACFAGALQVTLDAATCTASGIDPNDPNLSFAVSLPASAAAGECDAKGTCLVPLDKNGTWKAGATGGVTFPRALCTRITTGKALGIVKTTSCAAKDLTTPSCGLASSVSTTTPIVDGGGATDAPTTVSQDFENPIAFNSEPNLTGVAVDTATVYVTRAGAQPTPPGLVKIARADVLAAKQPAPVTVLFGYLTAQPSALVASGVPDIKQIVVRGAAGEVRVCNPTSSNDCPTFTVNGNPLLAMTPTAAYAYGDTGGLPGLFSIDLTTPTLVPQAQIAGAAVASMVHSGGTLYLGMADGSIQRCAMPCASAASLNLFHAAPAGAPSIVTALAADDRLGNKIFFMRVPADGVTQSVGGIYALDGLGTETQLATGADILGTGAPPLAPPSALAVDSAFVYWGGSFDDPRGGGNKRGLLRRNHVAGGPVEPFLENSQGMEFANAIAVDTGHVFWTYDRVNGAMQFAAKKRAF